MLNLEATYADSQRNHVSIHAIERRRVSLDCMVQRAACKGVS
jgi:hypothetical protein